MSTKEMSRPLVAQGTGQVETTAMAGASVSSDVDFNIISGRKQGRIEALLPHGETNAVQVQILVELTGARSVRWLQREIEKERANGALILSTTRGTGGYFLPAYGAEGRQEINAFIRTLTARASNTFRTLRAAKQALKELDGQQEIGGI